MNYFIEVTRIHAPKEKKTLLNVNNIMDVEKASVVNQHTVITMNVTQGTEDTRDPIYYTVKESYEDIIAMMNVTSEIAVITLGEDGNAHVR